MTKKKKKKSLEKCESTLVSSENELAFSCCLLNGLAMLHSYLLLLKPVLVHSSR